MVRNYFIVALRSLWRQGACSAINVLGLAVGIACSLVIYVFVVSELRYDRFHEKLDRIYRVGLDWEYASGEQWQSAAPSGLAGPAAVETVPGVEAAVRFLKVDWDERAVARIGDRSFFIPHAYYTDDAFFDVFSFPLRSGDPTTALAEPASVVISHAVAEAHFSSADPVGQTVVVQDTILATVTGVLAPHPSRSHQKFDLLLSYATVAGQHHNVSRMHWGRHGVFTYLLLGEGADLEAVSSAFADVTRKDFGETEDRIGLRFRHFLEPMREVYLHGGLRYEDGNRGNVRALGVLGVAAIVTLLIACINYMNLATARSTSRATEVGIRKTIGARRGQLTAQFMGESCVMVALSALLAAVLVAVGLHRLPVLQAIDLWTLFSEADWILLGGLIGLLALVSGSYPAFVLSRFRPTETLKGNAKAPLRDVRIRQGLVLTQLVISVLLLSGTLLVRDQVTFMMTRDTGYAGERVVVVPVSLPSMADPRYANVRSAIRQVPGVVSVSGSLNVPGREYGDFSIPVKDRFGNEVTRNLRINAVDYEYVETIGLELVAGRSFDRSRPGDVNGFLINETALKYLDWGTPDEAIGQSGMFAGRRRGKKVLLGVLRDYHYESLHRSIEPLVIEIPEVSWPLNTLVIRFDTDQLQTTMAGLRATWAEVMPDRPFQPLFLDANFDRQYRSDRHLEQVLKAFSLLGTGVAGLGLLGLVGYTVQQRRREVGIRKTLGAEVSDVVGLFSKDLLKLVIAANVIALPIVYYGAHLWLESFAHRVDFGLRPSAVACLVFLALAGAITISQGVRAANANPVDSLRT